MLFPADFLFKKTQAENLRPLSSVLNCGLAMMELTPTTCKWEERKFWKNKKRITLSVVVLTFLD
jgi:hypothetical protein